MSYEYRGFELNEYLEEPWYATDQQAFVDIIDFLPEKGETLAAGHYHSYIASAADESDLAVSANNDGTIVLNQYTTDGVLQTYNSDGSVGATGIAAEIIGSGNISEAEFENLNGSTTGIQAQIDAVNGFADHLAYFAGLGVTGVPVGLDGFIDNYVTHVGSAVYSEDGNVYMMSEAGFTGVTSILGCRFVLNPVLASTKILFGSASVSEPEANWASLSYTGAGGVGGEFKVYVPTTDGNDAQHLVLQTARGKLKLATSTAGGGVDGIVLSGNDDDGTDYAAAAGGKHRALYADEAGEMVLAESDTNQRYKSAGFTAVISTTYYDTINYSYWTYELSGDYVKLTIPEVSEDSANNALRASGLPSEIQPQINVNLPCIVRDTVNVPTGAYRPARVSFFSSSDLVNFYPMSAEGAYWTYSSDFGTTGQKGIAAQSLVYKIN